MPNVERDLDRCLTLLRNRIRERGFTQMDVQDALGWGRSYISQLLTKQKALRYEQILLMLNVIGLSPEEFFAELYPALRSRHRVAENLPPTDETPPAEINRLTALLRGLIRLLTSKGLITTPELTQAVEQARRER